jgi:hypothetical protein
LSRYRVLAQQPLDFKFLDSQHSSFDACDIPAFLRKEADSDFKIEAKEVKKQKSPLLTGLFNKLFSRYPSEHTLLIKVNKKLCRTVSKDNIPTLEQLIKWGLNSDISELIQAYFTQHGIGEQSAFIVKFLIWMNAEQNVLSAANIEMLENKIDELDFGTFLWLDDFIDELDEFESSPV